MTRIIDYRHRPSVWPSRRRARWYLTLWMVVCGAVMLALGFAPGVSPMWGLVLFVLGPAAWALRAWLQFLAEVHPGAKRPIPPRGLTEADCGRLLIGDGSEEPSRVPIQALLGLGLVLVGAGVMAMMLRPAQELGPLPVAILVLGIPFGLAAALAAAVGWVRRIELRERGVVIHRLSALRPLPPLAVSYDDIETVVVIPRGLGLQVILALTNHRWFRRVFSSTGRADEYLAVLKGRSPGPATTE